ncbi:DNA cytosine methyltransferase [Pseudomaricurvus alkylphenolicus]|uniref:DNA (cytosine-5-)-methyltransferase n=1 Tax=Pseudomaricurvus alkylphenolicus TaxID=1306991 RepID=UPI0014211B99|nr:DNA cytosine methyltransferase [Pseudomaricurvus alkylphenolicus]
MTISAVDLFCGVGGLTHGLQQSGVKVTAGYDTDAYCQLPYEANNEAQFLNQDVSELSAEDLNKHYDETKIRLLAGCAPCQPFSKYTQALPRDERWGLLYHFGRLAIELRPELITMENVPELDRHEVFAEFVKTLTDQGYRVWHRVVFCPDYGVPQNRKRLVLLASLLGEVELIPATHSKDEYVTLKEAIGSLPRLQAGKTNKDDPLHRCANLSDINLKRIKASKPGGTWKDWPTELQAACHKRDSGKKYTSVYGRLKWSEPSPTITTQFYNYGSGRYGHPTQARALSLREAAVLQSFPKDYKFTEAGEDYSITNISRMIGNAVPVALGKAIGDSLLKHIKA